MLKKTVSIILLLSLTATSTHAEKSTPTTPTTRQAFAPKKVEAQMKPNAIKLYPGKKDSTQNEIWTDMRGELWVRNISEPTLTPFLPDPSKSNGTAVLVVPGGGFKFVSISNEGWPIAEWLAERGVAAFVLKYRVDTTPENDNDFARAMMQSFRPPEKEEDKLTPNSEAVHRAVADAQTALRLIHSNAKKWNIDPQRVGMLGFSAGAMTTLSTALANAADARPDFIAPIYGFMTAVTPPPDPQPMFVAMASDDMLFNKQGFGLIESWAAAGGSTEFHWYQGGGHGFGSHQRGTTSDLWFEQFMRWMQAERLLDSAE